MTPKFPSPKSFLDAIRLDANDIEKRFGIPWLFAATQAAHESRYGNSQLAVEANNLFGLTAGSWLALGRRVYRIDTQEHSTKPTDYWNKPDRYFQTPGDLVKVDSDGQGGSWLRVGRPFRYYYDWRESLDDWANLIEKHYDDAYVAAMTGDFERFAVGLQSGGYATDPKYAQQLESVYELLKATV